MKKMARTKKTARRNDPIPTLAQLEIPEETTISVTKGTRSGKFPKRMNKAQKEEKRAYEIGKKKLEKEKKRLLALIKEGEKEKK